ncbi:MAG: LON peptidase substrate-binding domain-containing protein, partial [Thermomicrobiales bacterium]
MNRYDLYSRRYPLLSLKNVVIFPRNVVTLQIGRTRSIGAIEEAWMRDRRIVVTAHRTADIDEPHLEDLYTIGTIAEVLQAERQANGNIQVVLEGVSRVQLASFELGRPFFS